MVPSATETPIWGIRTWTPAESSTDVGCAPGSVGEELTARLLHVVELRQGRLLEGWAEGDWHVGCSESPHRRVEVLERLLADQRRDLGPHAAGTRRLVGDQSLARLADAGQ